MQFCVTFKVLLWSFILNLINSLKDMQVGDWHKNLITLKKC
jgi:hypothetical protein